MSDGGDLAQMLSGARRRRRRRRIVWLLVLLIAAGGAAGWWYQDRTAAPVSAVTYVTDAVTEGALELQKAGLIRYARGHITVLDRAGLERATCECYAVVKKEYDRLLPAATAR